MVWGKGHRLGAAGSTSSSLPVLVPVIAHPMAEAGLYIHMASMTKQQHLRRPTAKEFFSQLEWLAHEEIGTHGAARYLLCWRASASWTRRPVLSPPIPSSWKYNGNHFETNITLKADSTHMVATAKPLYKFQNWSRRL